MIPQRWWWWWWWFLRREEDAPPSSRCDGASSESESTTASRTCVDGGRRSTKRSLEVLLCDEDKGRHIFSSPKEEEEEKKKSLCLGFSHLGFRFVCLFGFVFFPFWIFLSFVRRKSPLFFSSHFVGSPHASSWTTRFVAREGRRGVVVVCRRRSFCFAFCVSCERRRRRPTRFL